MNRYVIRLKELENNFSYKQFTELLHDIDEEIINGNISSFDEEFIHYFKQITNFTNDKYIVDGKNETLGYKLVEDALINKERLTPTLAMCFFFEQKRNLGLDAVCNNVNFSNLTSSYHMMIVHDHDTGNMNLDINYYHCQERTKTGDIDRYNYFLMTEILHELTHVYQSTRTEQDSNIFDRLVYYDVKQLDILSSFDAYKNRFFHQAVVGEFMADEQARVYMLQLSKKHPEYFNSELIDEMQTVYQKTKIGHTGPYGNLVSNPREAYSELLNDLNEAAIENPNCASFKPLLEEIEALRKKSQPLIEELQAQGFSEKETDTYYNIFSKMFYSFDGKQIVAHDDYAEKFDSLKVSTEKIQEKEEQASDISTQDIGKRSINADTSDKSIVTRLFEKFKNIMKEMGISKNDR